MDTVFAIIVLLAATAVAVVVLRLQARRVRGLDRQRIEKLWKALDAIESPAMKVLHADAVFGKAMEAAGYQGTVGDMLKAAGPRFQHLNAVWQAHKLRNVIAHEPGTKVSDAEAKAALGALKKAIDDLL